MVKNTYEVSDKKIEFGKKKLDSVFISIIVKAELSVKHSV